MMRRGLVVLLLAGLAAGCSDRGTDPTDPGSPGGGDPVSYAADVQPIFNSDCTGCHGVGGSGGLDLRAGVSRGNLVGMASSSWTGDRVVAGDPDLSVLYLKVSGAGGVGDRMPVGGNLSADDIETIRLWIDEGAQDN